MSSGNGDRGLHAAKRKRGIGPQTPHFPLHIAGENWVKKKGRREISWLVYLKSPGVDPDFRYD